VAVDSSGSFPGFALATLIAAETLGAQTTCIVSLGSSTYGANRPGFTLADMVTVLVQKGLLRHGLSAVSAGGDDDQGGNLGGPERERALARAGAPVIREPDLGRNLAIRRGFLWSGQRPDLVVSVGGNLTSTGLDETFGPRTGLILPGHRSGAEGSPRGLIQLCLGEAIPVVRILDIRGLCALSGLPYDPIPVPAPGQSGYFRQRAQPPALLAAGVLLAVLLATLAGRWKQAP
jgi:poly-gamma-glutamate system protein